MKTRSTAIDSPSSTEQQKTSQSSSILNRSSTLDTLSNSPKSDPEGASHNPNPTEMDLSDKSTSDSDLSDDDDDNFSIPLSALRRSTRETRQVQRFSTSSGNVQAGCSSHVFSARNDVGGDHSADVKRLMRLLGRYDSEEAKLQEMREDVNNGKEQMDNEERHLKNLADDEKERTEKDKIAQNKYYEPLPLFSAPIQAKPWRNTYSKLSNAPTASRTRPSGRRNRIAVCLVEDMLNEMDKECNKDYRDIYASKIGSYIKNMYEMYPSDSSNIRDKSAEIMYFTCMFDDSVDEHNGIDYLFDALLSVAVVEKDEICNKFMPLSDVLSAYGAVFQELDGRNTDCEMPGRDDSVVCLDHAILRPLEALEPLDKHSSDDGKQEVRSANEQRLINMALRNVGRALVLAASQISSGWDLCRVMGMSLVKEGHKSDQVVSVVKACVWIMFSCFGSRLYKEAGSVLKAAVRVVGDDDWVDTRWKIGKAIMELTTRLHLHVELVTYLLPFECGRCLECSLDIAYLSLYQWCEGPADDPVHREVKNLEPSQGAIAQGVERVSFCVEDVANLVERVGEVDKGTDDAWANGLCHLLQQIMSMPIAVHRRNCRDLGRVHDMMQKLRHCGKRMKFGAGVHETRQTLDNVMLSIQDMCQDRRTRQELDISPMNLKQSTIAIGAKND